MKVFLYKLIQKIARPKKKSNIMDITEANSSEPIIDESIKQLGEYKQDILIDKRKLKQIQNENFSLSNYEGFKVGMLEKIGIKTRKHHLYHGLNIQERAWMCL
jgi:hypothetical protein